MFDGWLFFVLVRARERERARERDIYIYVFMYIYTHTHTVLIVAARGGVCESCFDTRLRSLRCQQALVFGLWVFVVIVES